MIDMIQLMRKTSKAKGNARTAAVNNALADATALYERLSRDDELEGESNSIVNQKKLLEGYAEENGFKNIRHYTDDGFTGGDFERPGWQQLVADVEAGIQWTSTMNIAATWNTELAEIRGVMVGEEALALELDGWYGVAMNIHRSPWGGRNFEYFAEDPLLSGKIAAAEVVGVQSKGVTAFIKHFAVNHQDTDRGPGLPGMVLPGSSDYGLITFVDEQTIREVYTKSFQIAVEEGGAMGLINTKEDALNAANALTVTVCEEGTVLLKNENNALPLSGGETISVFGKNSVNLVYGGSGSASSDRTGAKTIYESLDAAGFKYNKTLKAFYEDDSKSGSGRASNPSMESGVPTGIEIGETPVSSYTDDVIASFDQSDVAVVIFSRISGEGWDLPRTSKDKKGNALSGAMSADDHYLELNQDEQDMLKLACEHFDKVIVLINSSNAMELGFLDSRDDGDETNIGYDFASHIDAALWIGGVGNYGIMALGSILNGNVNPSGRLVDTYVRDLSKDPTWQNFSVNLGSTDKKADGGTGNSYYVDSTDRKTGSYFGKYTGYFYVEYEEGIYVGYRYYETAAYEGFIDFEEQVVYPFGYGLSYTTFSQSFDSLEKKSDTSGDIYYEAKVTVTNTGNVAGKDVVQLYYTAPYTPGGIEKAYVVLGAYDKTQILQPGASQTLTLTIYEQDIRELYLVPFRYTVEEGGTKGIMSSFNRIGTTWAGGSYALCTAVLRNEWGFDGMVISDFNANTTYMYADMMIRAGGDLNLCQDGLPSTSAEKLTATQASVIRTAAKNILYVINNSSAMNGDYTYGLAPWETVMYIADGVIAVLLLLWGFLSFRKAGRNRAAAK